MLAKVILVAILMSVGNAANVDSGIQSYRKSMQNDTVSQFACCPVIDRPDFVVSALPNYRASVSVIVTAGNCTENDRSFRCCVGWGDRSPLDCTSLTELNTFTKQHQYSSVSRSYYVGVMYCGVSEEYSDCCDSIFRAIFVSN